MTMFIQYKNENDVHSVITCLKNSGFINVTYFLLNYSYYEIFFRHPKLSHNFYIKFANYAPSIFNFNYNDGGIYFDIDKVNSVIEQKLNKKNKQTVNKNVCSVNKELFGMYVKGKFEEHEIEIMLENENVINGKYVCNGISHIVCVNLSFKKNPTANYDEKKVVVSSKLGVVKTSLANFLANYENIYQVENTQKENQ